MSWKHGGSWGMADGQVSAYEAYRQPIPKLPDNQPLKVPKKVMEQLRCPICMDILWEPVATSECLHRFCKRCIEKWLRDKVKTSCPLSCKSLPSKRELIPDEAFKLLIKAVFPDIGRHYRQREEEEERDAEEARFLARRQTMEEPVSVVLGLRPAPDDPSLPVLIPPDRFLTCPANVTMGSLMDVLEWLDEGAEEAKGRKWSLDVEVEGSDGGMTVVLDEALTLREVVAWFWNPVQELVLYYRPR